MEDKKSGFKLPTLIISVVLFLLFASLFSANPISNSLSNIAERVGLSDLLGISNNKNSLDFVAGDGVNGSDGQPGVDGVDGTPGATGRSGAEGVNGSNGDKGADGVAGPAGADGAPGSNDCISGICVSRQVGSPGTQETGNINIDGTVLAASLTTTGNAVIGGTATVDGHSAFGDGATVNGGISSVALGLSGFTSMSNTVNAYETVTGTGPNTTGHTAGYFSLTMDPTGASTLSGIGLTGNVETASGNSQNISGALVGVQASATHVGSGTLTTAQGLTAVIANVGGGDISTVLGISSLVANVSSSIDTIKSINISSAVNVGGGTVTNNYGLFIEDQSSVGTGIAMNIYSDGLNSNNWFQGFTSFGNITGPASAQVEIVNDGSGNSFIVKDTNYGDTSPFVIDSSGNVGIGTSTPAYKLDVNGVIRGTKFSGVSGTTTWLTAAGFNAGLFVTDTANPQTGSNLSFHINVAGVSEGVPAFSVTGGGASNAVAVIKGAASQSGNLQEWQNSSGTPLLAIDSSGNILYKTSSGNNQSSRYAYFTTTTGAGSEVTADIHAFSSTYTGQQNLALNAPSGGYIVINGNDFHTGARIGDSYMRLFDQNYGALQIYASGALNSPSRLIGDQGVRIETQTASLPVAIVRGAASQTGNLQEWQNSAGTPLNWVSSIGRYYFGSGRYIGDDSGTGTGGDVALTAGGNQLKITANFVEMVHLIAVDPYIRLNGSTRITNHTAATIGLRVQGAASQTANLQEWQTSAGTPVGYVSSTGTFAQSGATNCAVSANASGELECTSDERLKDIHGSYEGGLEQLNAINTIRYNFKDEDYTHVGFSAQNVGAVLPEGTPLQANGYLGLDSNAILALTVNSVKELDLEVNTLGVDFASALEQTQGDIDGATELLATQGLQLDQLSQTLQDYATQLSELNDRVDSLEAEVRILKQQNTSGPANDSPPSE